MLNKGKNKGKQQIMGMAASQARLLSLTNRKNDIGYELQMLSLEKNSITRETDDITEEYHLALNSKLFVFSNNNGVTYSKFNYFDLMKPGVLNQNSPKIITDLSNRVVVDSNYKQYAEMISPNGAPGAEWGGDTRIKILSELTGIDAEKLKTAISSQQKVLEEEYAMHQIGPKPDPANYNFRKSGTKNLLEKMPAPSVSFSNNVNTWANAYSSNATISLGSNASTATASFKNIVDGLSANLSEYFLETGKEDFEQACKIAYESNNNLEGMSNNSKYDGPISYDGSNYTLDVKKLIDAIMGGLTKAETTKNAYNNQTEYYWYDIDNTDAYSKWLADDKAWQEQKETLMGSYNSSVNDSNMLLTAEEESRIKFYDDLFSTIAERGWSYNSEITDPEYLNQVLINNMYTITTVERTSELEEDNAGKTYKQTWTNSYDDNIASNCSFLYSVNNTDAVNEALVEYEHDKAILNKKETAIDIQMKNLETELSAINQMIQSIEKVKNDNVDRTFGIFS